MNGPSLRGYGASMGKNSRKGGTSCPPPPLKINSSTLAPLKASDYIMFLEAPDVTVQLDFIRGLMKNSKQCSAQYDDIKFIIVVFLESPLKHPLKIACAKFLASTEQPEVRLLTYSKLQNVIESANMSDFSSLNNICNGISSSIDIFPPNIHSTDECISVIANFLKSTLHTYSGILCSKSSCLSPTKKAELYLFIHNIIRTMLSILQKTESKPNKNWLSEMCKVCLFFMKHHELPTDTKGNCGIILIILLNVHHGSDTWIKILESTFMENDNSDPIFDMTNPTDIIKLTISSAILNIIDVTELCSKTVCGSPALIFICHNLSKLSSVSSLDSVIILGSARSILNISKLLFDISDIMIITKITHIFLDFVWSHLDYYIDSVRHLTMQILSNIVKLALILDGNEQKSLSSTLMKTIIDVPNGCIINFKALICLGSEYNCSHLLQKNSYLPNQMLSNINNFTDSSNVTTAFEVLMMKHCKEVSADVFYDTWIKPILEKLSSFDSTQEDSSLTSLILSGILLKAVQLDSNILQKLMVFTLDGNISDLSDGKLKCILVCLNVARKYGYLDLKLSTPTIWKDVVSFKLLHIGVMHHSAEIRLLTFSLLIESHKTTEYFDESEFQLIEKFLHYNISVPSSNLHQKILSILKKLFERWQCGYSKILKSFSGTDNLLKNFHNLCRNYTNFIHNICILCMKSIYPGASFSRKNISMQTLIICQEIYNKNNLECNFWEKNHVPLIFDYLNDSFECNKQLSVSLLQLCPINHDLFNCDEIWLCAFKDAILRASSVKPTECMSSAYKIDLLINKHPQNIWSLYNQLGLQQILLESNITYSVYYNTIRLLLILLEKEKKIAEKSILLAASNGPMYGLLYCIRHLLGKLNMRLIAQSYAWSRIINNLIKISFDISRAVKLIVNNSSPEGHLPMDFNAGSLHIENSSVQLENGKSVTAQMVLLCAWRSIKEVSLLLGDISNQGVIMTDAPEFFLESDKKQSISCNGNITKQQMLDIGDHFITLLSETKHRGAFEQAYVGFSKLCLRLWKCDLIDLHNLPKIWIDDMITAISSGKSDNTKLCATRRSAGVPFIIQALVTTELQASNTPHSFQSCISTLLNLAQLKVNNNARCIETKVHCLNILRTLYRHTALGEHVNQYVTDGLVISIDGFDGATWAERNASTLLFSSLITRIFGVQRTKNSDQLSIRNKMTGRIFFLRYPKLYDYLLNALQLATECQQINSIKPSLYPILLLLSRLYPSSLEGTDSNLQLIAFIPHLVWCAGNCVLKIRQLTAKAIVPLISHERYFVHTIKMFQLIQNENISHNFKHGILLQLIKLLQHMPDNLLLSDSDLLILCKQLQLTHIILDTSKKTICFPILDAFLKVILLCLKRYPKLMLIDGSYFNNLVLLFEDIKIEHELSIGVDEFYIKLLHLKLMLILITNNTDRDEVFPIIFQNMTHCSKGVIQKTLNYILCLYNHDKLEEIEEKFDISNDEKSFVLHLSEAEICSILNCFKSSSNFRKELFIILKNSESLENREKCLIILTYLPDSIYELINCPKSSCSENILEKIISIFEQEHEQINYVYLKFLNIYLTENLTHTCNIYEKMNFNTIKIITRVLKDCSNDFQQIESIDIIMKHWKTFNWYSEKISEPQFEIIILQWFTIMKLLRSKNDVVSTKIRQLFKEIFNESFKNSEIMIVDENSVFENFLNFFTILMSMKSFDHAIAALTILAIGENDSYEFMQDEHLIFDKMEDSDCLEECEITFKCLEIIDRLIKDENKTASRHKIILKNTILRNFYDNFNQSSFNDFIKYINCENDLTDVYQNFAVDVTSFKMRKIFLFYSKN